MLKDNNGVGTVKKFTPTKSCLQGEGGGVEKNFDAISTPHPNITPLPPLEVF